MRRAQRSMLRVALASLVATGLVVVATPGTASVLPAGCTTEFTGVRHGLGNRRQLDARRARPRIDSVHPPITHRVTQWRP